MTHILESSLAEGRAVADGSAGGAGFVSERPWVNHSSKVVHQPSKSSVICLI